MTIKHMAAYFHFVFKEANIKKGAQKCYLGTQVTVIAVAYFCGAWLFYLGHSSCCLKMIIYAIPHLKLIS